MVQTMPFVSLLFVCSLLLIPHLFGFVMAQNQKPDTGRGGSIGVILDLGSRVGKEMKTAMEMAVEDLQRSKSSSVQLLVQMRDSHGDPLQAGSQAIDLFTDEIIALVAVPTWPEAAFVAQLATRSQIPLVSLSAPAPGPPSYPFVLHVSNNYLLEMQAIAAMIASYGWRRVNFIYDLHSGDVILASLTEALTAVGSEIDQRSVFPELKSLSESPENDIKEELQRLKASQTRVFVVHTASMALGSLIFREAKKMGMMEQGYVWIVTDSLSSLLESMNSSTISSMQGVLGVRSFFSETHETRAFSLRFQRRFLMEYPEEECGKPSIHGLRAYDTIKLLAQSMQKSTETRRNHGSTLSPKYETQTIWNLTIFEEGPTLLAEIISTESRGLSGEIMFRNTEVQGLGVVEIVNVFGKSYIEKGFWRPELGFWRDGERNSSSMHVLGQVTFPGPSYVTPKGWAEPSDGKKMRIGVPIKKGFKQFVEIKHYNASSRNETEVIGFAIDVFEEVVKRLPYALPYEFVPFNGSYDELVDQVYVKDIDAAVGDITILMNRSEYVDFSQPFAESGISMLVKLKPNNSKKAWMFMRPFTKNMWLVTGAIFIYTGIAVWFLEHKVNPDFRGPFKKQMATLLWFSFSTLFFAHRERLRSNYARVVLIVWLFVVLILTSSYTASLSSMLTVQKLEPAVTSKQQLLRSGASVGCERDSFVSSYMKEVLQFDQHNIKPYQWEDEFSQTLSNETIMAAFLEVPYLRLLLSEKNCKGFTTVGPTYKTGGFGFVFPRGSPLVADISKGILEISESGEMLRLENKWLPMTQCSSSSTNIKNEDRLSLASFWGLFLITGGISTFILLSFHMHRYLMGKTDEGARERNLWKHILMVARHLDAQHGKVMVMELTQGGTSDLEANEDARTHANTSNRSDSGNLEANEDARTHDNISNRSDSGNLEANEDARTQDNISNSSYSGNLANHPVVPPSSPVN
ncbi:glutamate receptor 2.7 isoform X2 [Amborella trichopoda]|nr:glutamate receptor 2.7 isoform X2 [Amborella trichopoda]|eukprot:XP_006852519.2 glutamate receptor 2.7 isoform X2 [Amborella trichopoda]